MIDRNYIEKRLKSLGFNPGVLVRYEEKHRYYHTLEHIISLMNILDRKKSLDDELFLTTVYHDAVYDPKRSDNEDRSAELFISESGGANITREQAKEIKKIILATKEHSSHDQRSKDFMDADLNILWSPLEEQIHHENLVFKEYQFMNYKKYVPERIKVLESINQKGELNNLIAFIRQRKPLIGVFCGSFSPFHKGHFNVLQKAEKIFDKVIIAFGKNPEKEGRKWDVPKTLQYRQIETYDGLLTDFIASLNHEVVVIRGLRNSTDFQYEQNQYRYIQELMPDIRIVNIFCDKEFEHISSSGIRTLEKFNRHQNYLLE
jgi:pantetheine-phosphate adenylyltransferase